MNGAPHFLRRGLVLVSVLATASLGLVAAPASAAASSTVRGASGTARPVHQASPDAPVSSNGLRLAATTATGTSTFSPSNAGTGIVPRSGSGVTAGVTPEDMAIASIFGPDDRVRITPTTTFPARAVVQITHNGAAHCTGWLISPDTVVTAGHCVHTGGSGGSWYTDLAVWPGLDGSSAPYGSCTTRYSNSVVGWVTDGEETYDYGALKLDCTIGYTTGWFGYWWQVASLVGQSTLVQGYPGDKPFGEQWRGDDVARTVAVSQARQVFYQNDTAGGMSGSPVFRNRAGCGQCAMAIHAYGFPHKSYPHDTYNHGTRITYSVFNNLNTWRNAP